LNAYWGSTLRSCTGQIRIIGVLKLARCVIDKENIVYNQEVIVADYNANTECLLGRDLIQRVPFLRENMDNVMTKITEASKQIEQMHQTTNTISKAPTTEASTQTDSYTQLSTNNLSTLCNLETDQQFVKTVEKTTAVQQEQQINELHAIEQQHMSRHDELEQAKNIIQSKLQTIAATSLTQLTPQNNQEFAFRFQLIDPKQTPIKCRVRPLPYHLKEKTKKAIEDQLNAGIIRPSFSEWSAALRVVMKEDGSIRITVDYKPVNKVIKGDSYPLPSVVDLYNRLAKAEIFSKIDMKAAYHQIPLHEDSIELTAFVCEFGLFEYVSMPMGIKTAPSWFQRFIEYVLHDFIDRDVLRVYLDDSILYTSGPQQHTVEALNIIARKLLFESFD
jgi:hypothetical protein